MCCVFPQAIQGLNGMQLGDKKLIVQRASVGAAKMIAGDGSDMAAMAAMMMSTTTTTTAVPMPINIPGLQVSTVGLLPWKMSSPVCVCVCARACVCVCVCAGGCLCPGGY